jgi:hypothetical protein
VKVRFSHLWRSYQGIFTITVLNVYWGYEQIGITIFNFNVEVEF